MLLNGAIHNEKHKCKRKRKCKTLTRKFANSKLLRLRLYFGDNPSGQSRKLTSRHDQLIVKMGNSVEKY